MSKGTNSERKRRRFEVEWEGVHDDLRTRVLMSENYTTARYRMLLISAIRKDISDEFKQLLELQMKIKFGEYDDAINYLNEVMRDNRDFIYKVIEMVADDYTQRGVENMEGFGCFFQHYELDQGVALFKKAADANPSKACPMLLAFLAMRPQAFNAVSGFLMETLRKSVEPPHGLVAFGNSLLAMNFGNLMPDDILFVCDAILRSAFRDSLTNVAGDNKDTRKKCDRNANKFISLTYPFFAAVSAKLGLPIFGAKVERSGVLLERLVASLPDKWSPPVTRVVAYALCIARLKMPSLTFNLFLTLWLPSFKGTRQKELKLEFEQSKSFMGNGVLNNIATLCAKLSPSSAEFQQCLSVAGEVETSHLISLAYLYTRQYKKCVEFILSDQAKDTADRPHLLATKFAAHFQLGNLREILQSALELLPVILKNEWYSPDSAISDGGATMETPFWFIRQSAAGHWLASLLLRSLRPLVKETSEDVLLSTVIVLSQVDFSTLAFPAFNEAISIAESKESFRCVGIFDFVSDPAVIDRLAFLATSRPECFFPEVNEDAEVKLQNTIEMRLKTDSEGDRIKSSLLYLEKVGNDLLNVAEVS
ncbi:hypothetical protein Y032_0327g2619 [Ancylostoma ceylanicum]|uniref:Uncharacterized protein n=1 Tax=Ancylostoma ceylanicum TaxID=53326 RepID=A0A016S079_9BILA|nr:hypothetical protein Y032_0327g2619 [Ancylostoma ceylanicum]